MWPAVIDLWSLIESGAPWKQERPKRESPAGLSSLPSLSLKRQMPLN